MNVYNDLCVSKENTAVALGFFDGIHIGHKRVIDACVKETNLVPTVFTFNKSPKEYFANDKINYLLQNSKKKLILENLGIKQAYFIDFKVIAKMTAFEFVKNILVDVLKAKKVFCGFNYHFGYGGKSDVNDLKEICAKFDIVVETTQPILYENEVVSSTRIRKSLSDGNIKEVNAMLNRFYSYNLTVKKGNQIGRTINTPTLNQPFPQDFMLPKFGVYASAVKIDDEMHYGVTNIGVKPTIGKYNPLSETWVPKNDLGDLYGEKVEVFLLDFIRVEKKFESIEKLHDQIILDSKKSYEIFQSLKKWKD